MNRSQTPLIPVGSERQARLHERIRGVVAHHTEEILAEVAPTLRRLRTLFLVLAISVPVFFAGLLFVLWHLAR